MTCKDCHHPIHWSGANSRWYHDDLRDTLYCPGQGMIWPAEYAPAEV